MSDMRNGFSSLEKMSSGASSPTTADTEKNDSLDAVGDPKFILESQMMGAHSKSPLSINMTPAIIRD